MMKTLKNFDRNLADLLSDAYKWEYTKINDNSSLSKAKKPKSFFTRFQWVLILISVVAVVLCPRGIDTDFAGYIISGMSLFVGLLFTLVVSLFDKFSNTDFSKYKKSNNQDLYVVGVRLKNFFKKTIILTLYSAIIAIVCILMLALTMMSPKLSTEIDIMTIVQSYNIDNLSYYIKSMLLLTYRISLCYLLLNFIYITKILITSFYDYIVNEIDKISLQ